jgi:hypothetical protein
LGNVTEWNDIVILKTIADENPLALPTFYTITVGSETKRVGTFNPDVFYVSRILFFRRLLEHPGRYIHTVLSNLGEILTLVIDYAAKDWIKGVFILILVGGVGIAVERRWLHGLKHPPNLINKNIADESLMGLAVYCVLTAAVPAVTNIRLMFLHETLI